MNEWLPWMSIAGSIASGLIGLWAVKSVRTVHVLINSRMTELLDATKTGAHAEGVEQGRAVAEAREIVKEDKVAAAVVDKEIREAGR